VVLNTASIQLIPTTVATLRLKYGASNPLDILPAIWITSLGSAATALILSRLFAVSKSGERRKLPAGKARVKA